VPLLVLVSLHKVFPWHRLPGLRVHLLIADARVVRFIDQVEGYLLGTFLRARESDRNIHQSERDRPFPD